MSIKRCDKILFDSISRPDRKLRTHLVYIVLLIRC
jgi:hypothetical protein